MKLVEYKCKNCGAKLKIAADAKDVTCQMCGSTFHIDDETIHHDYVHKVDDPEGTAYKATRGMLRARDDAIPEGNKKIVKYFFIGILVFFGLSVIGSLIVGLLVFGGFAGLFNKILSEGMIIFVEMLALLI